MVLQITLLIVSIIIAGYLAIRMAKVVRQRKLAKWARTNKRDARLMLVGFNLTMVLIGVSLGLLCGYLGLKFDKRIIWLTSAIFLIATLLFPSKFKGDPNIAGRYERKQRLTILRITASGVGVVTFANQFVRVPATRTVHMSAGPAILIVLLTLGFIVVGLAILALSCGIICNGHESLGLMVLFFGWSGLIALYVFGVRKIIYRERKQEHVKYRQSPDLLDDLH